MWVRAREAGPSAALGLWRWLGWRCSAGPCGPGRLGSRGADVGVAVQPTCQHQELLQKAELPPELPHRRRRREGEQVQGLNRELLRSLLTQQILAGPCQAPGTHRKVSALPFEGCHEGGRRKSRSPKVVVPFLQTGGWSTVLVHPGLSHWLGAPQGELCRDSDLGAGSSRRSWPEEGRRGMLGAGRGVQLVGGDETAASVHRGWKDAMTRL